LQIKSAPFFLDFHFKSALIDFGFLTAIKRFAIGFVECGVRGAESKSLGKVLGSQDGIHGFHNEGAFPQSFF